MLLRCFGQSIASGVSVIKVVSHSSRFVDCIAKTARPTSNDRDMVKRATAQLLQSCGYGWSTGLGFRRSQRKQAVEAPCPEKMAKARERRQVQPTSPLHLHSPSPSTCEAYCATSAGPPRAIALDCCPDAPARLCLRDAPSAPPLFAEPMAYSGSLPPKDCRHHGLTPYGSNRQRARTPRSRKKRLACPETAN